MLNRFWTDETGVIISAELVLVLTIAVLAMIVGLQAISKATNHELADLASAFGAIDQTYTYDGIVLDTHSAVNGSAFADEADDCDCSEPIQVTPTPKSDSSTRNVAESGS